MAAATVDDLVKTFATMVDERKIVGAQLVLGDAENIRLSRSFGKRNITDGKAVNDDTLFCIGSCSKMFAAAVIMTLVADGSLDLDTPIDRWLPKFKEPQTAEGPAERAPTLRELLCHRAGIYSQRNRMTRDQARWIRDFRLTLKESVDGIAKEKLIDEPGRQYRYSGAGYCVLGRVAEAAAGKPFNQLLQERICQPLGLASTTFFPQAAQKNVAVGHHRRAEKFVIATNTPHLLGDQLKLPLVGGSIYSTASEAARFARMMLNRGQHNGRKILEPAQWSEMTKPQSLRNDGGYGFGIGVRVNGRKQLLTLSHSGALAGSYSQMLMDLQSGRFGVATYTGRTNGMNMSAVLARWVSSKPTTRSAHHAEGFYKDIFMDGGVNLSSRRSLPAAESLGLSYEFYAGRDTNVQSRLVAGDATDHNGALLYPDGQPRFRMIYVNGGGATAHGRSMEMRGRKVYRQFFNNGGSYSGSCAGSFLSGRNTDQRKERRLGYLHIFPYNTLNTGVKKTRVGHKIPHGSPLLEYHDFGGDYYVSNIYHNNGNWLSRDQLRKMKNVEVLATYEHPDAKHKINEGAAIWAFKNSKSMGRILNIGSHPEGAAEGERLRLTEACFQYALAGIGQPQIKGRLQAGVVRKMNKGSKAKDPAHARIGDRQYHHFDFEITDTVAEVTIELEGEPGFDLCLYLNEGSPAFRSNFYRSDVGAGARKTIKARLESGHWFVSVECATTVTAELDDSRSFFNYSGNTKVLNGAAYQLRFSRN